MIGRSMTGAYQLFCGLGVEGRGALLGAGSFLSTGAGVQVSGPLTDG